MVMSTDVTRQYENKIFNEGQFKQFALKFVRFHNVTPLDCNIILTYKEDDLKQKN